MSRIVKIPFTVVCNNGDGRRELLLPGRNAVCRRCDGTGSHTNPAIDEHGISPSEFEEDPDFREAYFSGVYDVRCEDCRGERVVPEIVVDRLPKALRARVEATLDMFADERAERAHYRRLAAMGIEY